MSGLECVYVRVSVCEGKSFKWKYIVPCVEQEII